MPYPIRREDECIDIQRMPGTQRATPPSTPYRVHTTDHPFCFDPACSCHEQRQAIDLVNSWVEQGSMTEEEATNFVAGRTF